MNKRLSRIRSKAGRKGGLAPHKKYTRNLALLPPESRLAFSRLGVEARKNAAAIKKAVQVSGPTVV